MAQQDTPQAQAEATSQAAATEAGFTLFTHLARAPEVSKSHPSHRYFAAHWLRDGCSANIHLMRGAQNKTAFLSMQTSGAQERSVSATTNLTADQCEALARALLDAAHDLRANSSAALMAAATVEGKEVAA